jgi:hypothetical protein
MACKGDPGEPRCDRCRHFVDDPARMEAELPGIQILGSMYGSARGDSGFCAVHARFASARDCCAAFAARDAGALGTATT